MEITKIVFRSRRKRERAKHIIQASIEAMQQQGYVDAKELATKFQCSIQTVRGIIGNWNHKMRLEAEKNEASATN